MITDFDRALVRAIAASYDATYGRKGIGIDRDLAHAQHAAYVSALRQAGVTVTSVDADETFYDCVFIEDTAVVWRDRALMTRMTPHREGEQAAVVAELKRTHHVHELRPGAKLEGGDVLHTESTTYVGLTGRTNEQGVHELAGFLRAFNRVVVPVRVSGTLHLKSVATYLGEGTVLVAPGYIDASVFGAHAVITTAPGEDGAANAIRVRDTLILRDGFPGTLATVGAFADRRGVRVVLLNLSEFEKGGGSASCLSILWSTQPI